jgi:Family of unknown function (DUF6459)
MDDAPGAGDLEPGEVTAHPSPAARPGPAADPGRPLPDLIAIHLADLPPSWPPYDDELPGRLPAQPEGYFPTVMWSGGEPATAEVPAPGPEGDGDADAGTRQAGDKGGGPASGRARDTGRGPAHERAGDTGGPASGRDRNTGSPASGRDRNTGSPASGRDTDTGSPASGRDTDTGSPASGRDRNASGPARKHPGDADGGPRSGRAPSTPDGDGDRWPSQFAQVLAETLAGSRPASQITPWTTERARAHIRRLGPLLAAGQRPRVQRVLTSRPVEDVVEVAVVVGFGPRTRALAARLERAGPQPATPGRPARQARWLCTDVESA